MRTTSGSKGKKQALISKKSTGATSDDNLSHLAFDNGVQANIITTASNGKIAMANSAACKLLGYSKKELLTKSRAAIFDINESSFKKMLKQRTAEGRSVAVVTAIKKTGKIISCEISSAVFMDADGIEKAITSITDLSQSNVLQKNIDIQKEKIVADNIVLAKSKQKDIDIQKEKIVADNIVLAKSMQKNIDSEREKKFAEDIILARTKSDSRIEESEKWIKHIAKTSYDVMWDWNIVTGQIYVGDSVEEVFGYKAKNNNVIFSDFSSCLLPEERYFIEKKLLTVLSSVEKNWDDSFLFKRQDGSVASTICRASIVRNERGKAIRLIGAIQDISRVNELEKKLEDQIAIQEKQAQKFQLASKLSFDVIWDWDIVTNEVFLGDGFEELFGYKIKDGKGDMISDWVSYLHPDDKEAVIEELQNIIKSPATDWEHAYRVTRADGSIARVYVRASVIRHPDGKAYRMIGAMQDLSRQKDLEERLEQEIKLKENQIAAATQDAKEMERSDLGKELHDNVNQLLAASRMYLEMSKKGGEKTELYLSRSSQYTLEAIEEIRKLTKGLTNDRIENIGLSDSIDNLVCDTMETNPVRITCSLQGFNENSVHDKFKLNVFRIVQEELNNILKHANATKINIRLSQNTKNITLSISDNGVGFDTLQKRTGIGMANIKSRVASHKGTAEFVSQPGQGCALTAIFPFAEVMLKN